MRRVICRTCTHRVESVCTKFGLPGLYGTSGAPDTMFWHIAWVRRYLRGPEEAIVLSASVAVREGDTTVPGVRAGTVLAGSETPPGEPYYQGAAAQSLATENFPKCPGFADSFL